MAGETPSDAQQSAAAAASSPGGTKKKKACAECRQQKMRCDADPDSDAPCSRCKRLSIQCIISSPFKRTHKRKRLQELEEETHLLKRRLEKASSVTPRRDGSLSTVMNDDREMESNTTGHYLLRVPENATKEGETLLPLVVVDPLVSMERSVPRTRLVNAGDPTAPRVLDALELSPVIIDDLFELFFRDYNPLLPTTILDSTMTANAYFNRSPFLFWTIAAIGSRRYNKHPSLTTAMAPRVTSLALSSLNVRAQPLQAIKGLLLILTWPFASNAWYRDPSFILSGALLHMAMQCGLHAPMFGNDFAKVAGRQVQMTEQEVMKRAELWSHCVITYNRCCLGSGQAIMAAVDMYNQQDNFRSLLQQLPTTVRLQLQLHNINARLQKALLEIGLLSMSPQQERSMDSLLRIFESEIQEAESLAQSDMDRFYVACARQDVVSMYFYKSPTNMDAQICMLIFESTCKYFELLCSLDDRMALSRRATRFMLNSCLMSLAVFLRLLKGPYVSYLDSERGTALFLKGKQLLSAGSLEHGDLPERGAAFAEQIWNSDKAFKNPDGSFNMGLKTRTRFGGGPLHDAIRWWRELYVDTPDQDRGPGVEAEQLCAENQEGHTPALTTQTFVPNLFPSQNDILLDDQVWGDLGLAFDSDWSFSQPPFPWAS
ncbi:hypothetical protein K402DRAFT_400426 [Aulographum hederae CBS 113979]|uniref:Zn(2)-C6 fungal-type domain-containing protein n=1 Tax=Aulographum hederae CBS 113979 TaxID=1176131 RepID=A0A6G1HES6_9PEZI|nr:hypothetical protein K402DRAFT_400426 [Aulographum hederae CBS 113979]